jgi:uncharacterized protein YjaZ
MSNINFTYKLTESNIYAHFLYRINPKDADILDKTNIVEEVKKSVQEANKHLNHKDCNILIFADTFAVIPEQGIGGRCGQSDIVNIFIDPNHAAGAKHNIETWLPSSLTHELYHARWAVSHKFETTLGEALIEEGAATVFEEFMYPSVKVAHAHHLSVEELSDVWQKAKPLLDSKDYNRDDWFYGGSGIKKWTGYSLGYEMVSQYIKNNPGKNPADLVDIDPQEIIRSYKLS